VQNQHQKTTTAALKQNSPKINTGWSTKLILKCQKQQVATTKKKEKEIRTNIISL